MIISSPGRVCAQTASRLPMVPLGTYTAACLPSSAATIASRRLTVGSSPHTSSPTSAVAIARRIPSSGTVKVSLRRSIAAVVVIVALVPGRRLRSRPRQGTPAPGVADHADAVATGALGLVEGVVGEAEELAGVAGVVGIGDATDADGDVHLLGLGTEIELHVCDGAADLLRHQPPPPP